MRNRATAVAALALLVTVVAGLAIGPGEPVDRVATISRGIRCPVCQAESIADSPSTTAREMVDIVEEQVAAGRSDEEIEAYFVARYGRWILLDPGLTPSTIALWALPALALLVGFAVVRRQTRGHGADGPDDVDLARLRREVAALRERVEGHGD